MKEKNLPISRLHTLINIFQENVSIFTQVPGGMFFKDVSICYTLGCYYVLFWVWGISKNTSGIKCLLTDNFRCRSCYWLAGIADFS